MRPDILDSTLQFVPNWKAITIPDTTPRPKAMPNILSQKSKRTRYAGRPVFEMWRLENGKPGCQPDAEGGKDDVKRNRECELEPREEKGCGVHWKFPALLPEVRSGEAGEVVTAASHDGLQHVEIESLCHFDGDAGRNGQHHSAHRVIRGS
jgi:hypothetical protein